MASLDLLELEKLKPRDVSDIANGDWFAAKEEIGRLRNLLAIYEFSSYSTARVVAEGTQTSTYDIQRNNETEMFTNVESPEGRAFWAGNAPGKFICHDEKTRQMMINIQDKVCQHHSHLSEAFLEFDKSRNGLISIETFKDAMGDLGIYLTEDEINHIKECYMEENDGLTGINYELFFNLMTSDFVDDSAASYHNNSNSSNKLRPISGKGEPITVFKIPHNQFDEQDSINKRFDDINSNNSNSHRHEGQYEVHRLHEVYASLALERYPHAKDGYKKADRNESNSIEVDDLLFFLMHLGIADVEDEDAIHLMSLLDTDCDGKLSYSEYVKSLHPEHK